MSGGRKPNESGERNEEREREDRADLSSTGQHCLTDCVYMKKKRCQTHFHDLCLSSEHRCVLFTSNQGQPEQIK